MGFLSFWPLAFLLLVPIIILLYILRQETKPKEFSSSMLWREVVRNMEATQPWEKLKRNILLFLQILTVVLFIAAMMHPWIKGIGKDKTQAILVIDNSASMATSYKGDASRLEEAKDAACTYIDELPTDAEIYVISGNQQAVLELANSKDKIEAKRKIKAIQQTMLAGNLTSTLGIVESCMNQSKDPEVVFFTDTAFDTGKISASIDSFYSDNVNVSLESVSYAFKDSKLEVLVQLNNHSSESVSREINLYGIDEKGQEKLLEITSIDLEAKTSDSVFFEIETKGLSPFNIVRAEINEKDALVEDNSSWCVLAEQSKKQVLLYTKSNMFIEKAMSNMAGVSVYRTSDESIFDNDLSYDLYIFDGMVPDKLPASGSMMFINCDGEGIFTSSGKVTNTRLGIVDSEVTTYVADSTIGVNEACLYDLPSWAFAYIEGSKKGETAGFYGIFDGRKVVTMGFDLHQTDFGLQAEFPILISNLSGYLLDGSLIEESMYTVGDSIMLHGSTKGSSLLVRLPDGKKSSLAASEVSGSYMQVTAQGIYQVSQDIDGQTISQQFVALFPTLLESEVESVENTIADSENVIDANIKAGALDVSIYIIILLLLLMLVEWIVYVRLM